ncbi:receptor-type tyrosine-protein phosphatase H [Puntigrus tetrazona]|uniref:receptor-type tyrosine-protein phosphatase H n=1 Tax=Puntigrus tetrazona TaxID=1606681 RepID=UPI001C89C323|nr:receptor-type tyrosine-protein phosphatase H [Puntigrus tetrazona]
MNTLWLPLLLSSVVRAEDQYFPQSTNATWDQARLHCRSCFREMTTVTSRNVHLVVQNLSWDYWVGLRKSYNGSFPWAAWSNGDPVTYQNWYPGHPVPNKDKKLIPICPSTTESPASSATTTSTATPATSTVTSAPVTFPKSSTMWTNRAQEELEEETCPILNEMLDCLNMTCPELEIFVAMCNRTTIVTPKTTKSNQTLEVTTFSTTFNATTAKSSTARHVTNDNATTQTPTTQRPTTQRTTTSDCVFEPEPDPEHYIEDACVALLSFGMWKEKDCNTSLPYICYEERFFGQIGVFDKDTSSANVSWSEGPGAANISHYRVEITGDKNQTFNQTDLSQHVQDLTAGTLYSVQVFPVKCGRYLNPQNISFYTQPSDVQNLTIEGVTTNSAFLTWSKPEGNSDFYLVTFLNDSKPATQKCSSVNCTITGLIPGAEYLFTVKAVVNQTFEGVACSASDHTVPSTVRNLKSADNDSTVITATWEKPVGEHSGYRYYLQEVDNSFECPNCSVLTSSNATNWQNTEKEVIVESGKSDGVKFCLCVAALTKKNSLSGEMLLISAYTRPKSVILSLDPKSNSMNATWDIMNGKFQMFEVTIKTDAYQYSSQNYTTDLYYNFQSLKAGVKYTVTVVTLNGNLRSKAVELSCYTYPTTPDWVNATAGKTSITLFWGPPKESQDALIQYKAGCQSVFWKTEKVIYTNETKYTFTGLNAGTRYILKVSVVAGNLSSDSPATTDKDTVPDRRTLTLSMLCSSETLLHCDKNDTRTELLNKLRNIMSDTFQNNVHWNLNIAKRP